MTNERFNELWQQVVVNAFYEIEHAEMVELMRLAKIGISK